MEGYVASTHRHSLALLILSDLILRSGPKDRVSKEGAAPCFETRSHHSQWTQDLSWYDERSSA